MTLLCSPFPEGAAYWSLLELTGTLMKVRWFYLQQDKTEWSPQRTTSMWFKQKLCGLFSLSPCLACVLWVSCDLEDYFCLCYTGVSFFLSRYTADKKWSSHQVHSGLWHCGAALLQHTQLGSNFQDSFIKNIVRQSAFWTNHTAQAHYTWSTHTSHC